VRYEITHRTSYTYASDVSVSHHVARLAPRSLAFQQCFAHEMTVEPRAALITQRDDYYGNRATFFSVPSPHRSLVVTARSQVELLPRQIPSPASTPAWETVRDLFRRHDASPQTNKQEFIFPSPMIPRLPELGVYAKESFFSKRPFLEAVLDLNSRMYFDFKFDPKATTVATPLEQVIKHRRGVCQDFAHFQIGCFRALGLPARYVSGYLETMPPAGKPRLVGADASHAWVQIFIPDTGWIDVDPTNNLLPSVRHVIVAWGRDFSDVSPIRGVILGGGKHELRVSVDVKPLTGTWENAGNSSGTNDQAAPQNQVVRQQQQSQDGQQ
jgi:transglutaminase-like putative cysteine protease